MKKIVMVSLAALAALTASAELYYGIVNTIAWQKDKPSDANAVNYSGYLCTVESAETLFGGNTSASDITGYMAGHYQSVVSALQLAEAKAGGGVLKLSGDADGYTKGQYAVTGYSAAGLSGDYLAVLLYLDEAIRVFGADSAQTIANAVVFDDQGKATGEDIGGWTAVPEPASGLLLLFGLGGMALRRKRKV